MPLDKQVSQLLQGLGDRALVDEPCLFGAVDVHRVREQVGLSREQADESLDVLVARGMVELRTYADRALASVAVCAFLKAIRAQASISRARWFSAFFDQRTSRPRLRFSQEWQASTTQRRARQPGVCSFSAISSPRLRMWAVKP